MRTQHWSITLFPYTTIFRSPTVRISVDRGPEARGCRLDPDALERSVAWSEAALDRAEFLVVNKFGKQDRKSTRLNSSHMSISYAGVGVKKKNKDDAFVVLHT